jgi:hypothetical protein
VFKSLEDGSKTKDTCIPEGEFNEATTSLLKAFVDDM